VTELGTVSGLQHAAVKGFGISSVDEVMVTRTGVAGDRELFVVDARGRLLSATRTGAFLPYTTGWDPSASRLAFLRDGREIVSGTVTPVGRVRAHFYDDRYCDGWTTAGPFDAWLSDLAGEPVRLVRADGPSAGVDVAPLSLVSEATLAAIEVPEDGPRTDARRFRLNLTVRTLTGRPYDEDGWAGATVSVGGAVLRLGGPIPRCAAVQHHPTSGDRGTNVLKRIFEQRGRSTTNPLDLGVYAEVLTEGRVAVGDVVVRW
jgi:uncharacterized protein YcbX